MTARNRRPDQPEFVLALRCPEATGLVYAVTGFLFERGGDIIESVQFSDEESDQFFLRIRFTIHPDAGLAGRSADEIVETLRADFEALAAEKDMGWWALRRADEKKRVLIMVSKFGHCLNDLLYRARSGDLPIEVAAVVSNHRDHEALVGWHSVPFFHVPVTKETKADAEARLLEIRDRFDADLVVLARYMQVLSPELTEELAGKCINIHHSFLPSFKGAKPYHQAHARGVKMVGATAHYVNNELDEGPIIVQEAIPVDHTHTADDLVDIGRDAEIAALTKAVRWHCEDRVFLNGGRTVVLR